MADNVTLASGALVVGTVGDQSNVQIQRVIAGFRGGAGLPVDVSATNPMPVVASDLTEIMTALLVEQRITNALLYCRLTPEFTETVETLRTIYQGYPITP